MKNNIYIVSLLLVGSMSAMDEGEGEGDNVQILVRRKVEGIAERVNTVEELAEKNGALEEAIGWKVADNRCRQAWIACCCGCCCTTPAVFLVKMFVRWHS